MTPDGVAPHVTSGTSSAPISSQPATSPPSAVAVPRARPHDLGAARDVEVAERRGAGAVRVGLVLEAGERDPHAPRARSAPGRPSRSAPALVKTVSCSEACWVSVWMSRSRRCSGELS